jgi:hypothetical protein
MPAKYGFVSEQFRSREIGELQVEKAVEEIESASRDPIGRGRQSRRSLINRELLGGFIGPDVLEEEEQSTRCHERSFRGPDETIEGQHSVDLCVQHAVDFRDRLDAGECRCKGDEVCILCCTQKDLLDVSPALQDMIDKQNRHWKRGLGEVFDLVMPRLVAEALGFLDGLADPI